MARQPAIKNVTNELRKRIDSSIKLYEAVIKFTNKDTWEAIQGYESLYPGQAKKIIALAFLDVISQWEVFVENCFIRFLAGAKFLNNNKPKLRLENCQSIQHAYQLLTITYNYDPTKDFLSFNSWSNVEEKARIFFKDGEPFTLLTQIEKQRLKDATAVRNRVAHYSSKCRSEFKKLARQFLNINKLWGGFSVGDFLIYETSNRFGNQKRQSIFLHYMELFKIMSSKIAKG